MGEKGLSTAVVVAASGASLRQVHWWASDLPEPVIIPAVVPMGKGPGYPARWSREQLQVVRALVRLAALGAGTDVLRRAAAELAEWEDWTEPVVMLDEPTEYGSFFPVTDLFSAMAIGWGWLLDLDDAVTFVEDRIGRLDPRLLREVG